MPKCVICGDKADFLVKGTSDYYCEECAKDCFSDLNLLQTVEQQAQQVKKLIEEAGLHEDEEEQIEEPLMN